MQKLTKFFLVFFLIIFVWQAQAQDILVKMQKADDLFQKKKYTEALDIYESIFKSGQKASPKMLLKMAFIYEGLNDYTKTLYYLNLYYHFSPDSEVLTQMDNIANQYRLKGYEHSDLDYAATLYQRFFYLFALAFLGLCSLTFVFILYRQLYKHPIPQRYRFAFVLTMAALLVWIYLTDENLAGIISQNNTYLMSAPSSGAEVVKVVEKGHKVRILAKEDVWYKIAWEKQTLYVKANHLLLIKI
jgi:tetratricopeptide (TPR) repeat protein